MAFYRCGPTALGSRTSWGPVSSPGAGPEYERPLSGNYDRIFNAFERTTAFEYVRNTFQEKDHKREERHIGHQDVVVNRKMSSSFERADCALAAQTPCDDDEDFYREKILYSQARQLFPLQEDLADWINKTIGISYLTGENFLDVLDNGAELCQLAAVIHDRAREAFDQGLIAGPVPQIKGRCWQRAARRSFFSRDNAENFLTFCRELGVHENLLFESDDLVLHNQPRQVILCLLEVARLAARCGLEPPGLVQLEKEIAQEERDSGIDSSGGGAWQFREASPHKDQSKDVAPPSTSNQDETQVSIPDNVDAESTKSEETVASTDSDVPLKPTNELDKRVQLVTRLMERGCSCGAGGCSKLLKVKKVGEGRYNIAGRNVFIRLLKGRHMMVRVGGGWDTLEHFLSRHEPCQVRLVTPARRAAAPALTPLAPLTSLTPLAPLTPRRSGTASPVDSKASSVSGESSPVGRPGSRPVDPESPSPSGRSSPVDKSTARRTSTPIKPTRGSKPALTLPLKGDDRKPGPRPRKQSAPSLSTPGTPTGRSARTPPGEYKKSPSAGEGPAKPRSLSLAKPLCGAEKPTRTKRIPGAASASAEAARARKTRSQSLASTPVDEPKRTLSGAAKKTRSMSLAATPEPLSPAAMELSIRASLEAAMAAHDAANKPFLHIKAKYRSPPPREVPPR